MYNIIVVMCSGTQIELVISQAVLDDFVEMYDTNLLELSGYLSTDENERVLTFLFPSSNVEYVRYMKIEDVF